MKNIHKKFLFASATFALVFSTQAAATPDNPLVNQSREVVSFSWAIQDGYVPNPFDALSNTEESVEYWQTVSASELSKGVNVHTSAPGALIRISERVSKGANSRSSKQTRGVDPVELEIQAPSGQKFSKGKAMSVKVSPQAMRDAGSPFPEGTAGFKLKSSLGHGTFKLRNSKAVKANAQYTLHVYDKDSSKRLSVTREKADYQAGSLLNLQGDFTDSSSGKYKAMNISDISGFVLSPKGKTLPLKVKRGTAGQFTASLPLSSEPEFGGLYEAYIDAASIENGAATKRRVKTAFALVKPTAKMGPVHTGTLKYGLPVNLNIQENGRYEVRGVLYGTNDKGQMKPFLASSTAQWLEPGKSVMKMSFDPSIVANSGLKAPFELRHLQLLDQSRMGSLDMSQKSISIISEARSEAMTYAVTEAISAPAVIAEHKAEQIELTRSSVKFRNLD